MITSAQALDALAARSDTGRAQDMANYHKVARHYLGLGNDTVEDLVRRWRADLERDGKIALAAGLWDSDIHEARIAAAKLLSQSRIRPDDTPVWDELQRWVVQFDSWAIADTAAKAIERRLISDPRRLTQVAAWIAHDNMWTRRAALVSTLHWAKGRHPDPDHLHARETVLAWMAALAPDPEWFIQKAIGWWLRTLSKHDPARVSAFLDLHSDSLRAVARKEGSKYL